MVEGSPDIRQHVQDSWPRAQAHWPTRLRLPAPVLNVEQATLLQIDVGTRGISINPQMLCRLGLLACCEALLTHALGQVLRYPGMLARQAQLTLLEQQVLPFPHPRLLEPFTDVLVDAAVDPSLRPALLRVYRAAPRTTPLDCFLLLIREELWQTPLGALLGGDRLPFERSFPGCRAQAHLLAEGLLAASASACTKLLHFLWVVSRYLDLPGKGDTEPSPVCSLCCLAGQPSPEVWARALVPTAEERAALKQAGEAGWISPALARRLLAGESLRQRILALPGAGSDDATLIPEVMAAYYRRHADRLLSRLPQQERQPEMGRRPRLEIYLDVSGSTPDPRFQHNPLTLAAQVLTTAAIRVGGSVRLALYSSGVAFYWQWCSSEIELSRFLMHYIGSGTRFPFGLLEESLAECRQEQPVRVILSDEDFDLDHDRSPEQASLLCAAAAVSPHLVLLLHQPDEDRLVPYRQAGATVLAVEQRKEYPRLAVKLAQALLAEEHHVPL